MIVRVWYASLSMAEQAIGTLSVMTWREIFIDTINYAKPITGKQLLI